MLRITIVLVSLALSSQCLALGLMILNDSPTATSSTVTITKTDDFNAGVLSGLGTNWTVVTSQANPRRDSSSAYAAAVTRTGAYWSADTFPDDQCVTTTITGLDTVAGHNYGSIVRAQAAAESLYYAGASVESGGILIKKLIAGTWTDLVSASGITWALNDTIKLCAIGDDLTAYRNDILQLTSTGTATELTGGQPGIFFYAGTTANLDDFSAEGY